MKSEFTEKVIYLLTEKKGIPINEMKTALSRLTPEEFNTIVITLLDKDGSELFELFNYYLILFKDIDKIKELLGSPLISIDVLEKILLISYTRAKIQGIEEDQALDNILIFINQSRYLELLLHSDIISRDRMLSYYLLTKLDRQGIDTFFNSNPSIKNFLKGFIRLPDRTIKTILLRNPDLFGYISLFLKTMENEKAESFIKQFRVEIEEMEATKRIVLDLSERFNIHNEKKLPLSERNKERLSEIIRKVKSMNNIFNTVYTLEHEGVIIDSVERTLIMEIMQNPVFKDILEKFSARQTEELSA
ncbi:MAG: hypothetical protein JXK07_04505 [Spirochaetes bacterium]|nr:hypothetical protein [Spirochaetota bacterium]MBN2770439.1 hypothetical protein [Spirochaetota bacterium]